MIPNEFYNLPNVFEPSFKLNDDQQALNTLLNEAGGMVQLLKKRNIGMTTFLALLAVYEAREPKEKWERRTGSLIICPTWQTVKHTINIIKFFHPDYNPKTNNSGIQVVGSLSETHFIGTDLGNTNIIIDELPATEEPILARFCDAIAAHFPRRIIITASVPQSFEPLFRFGRRGFVNI